MRNHVCIMESKKPIEGCLAQSSRISPKSPAVSTPFFVELRFKPGTWAAKGIPEQGCRVRQSTLDKLIGSGGQYDISDLVDGLID